MGCQSSSSAALTEEPLRKPRRPGTVSVGKLASPMSSGLERCVCVCECVCVSLSHFLSMVPHIFPHSGAAAGPGTELQRVESLKRVAELVSTREASMKWRRLPRGAPAGGRWSPGRTR